MIKNYLKTAWRNLLRNRTLSLINLTGLSISVAFCALLFFHMRYEASFDTFHANGKRLYRVEMSNLFARPDERPKTSIFASLTADADQRNDLTFPLVAGPDMKNQFPDVNSFVRFQAQVGQLVRADKSVYKETQTVYADASFFTSFSFPLVKGDARTALATAGNVVLSASTAKKYFGDKDPIGRTIELVSDSNRLLKVVGVAADAPANSSIQFSVVVPVLSDPDYAENIRERFNQMSHELVIELKPGVDERAFERKVNLWMKGYFLPDVAKGYQLKPAVVNNFRWYLRPLAACHYNVSGQWGHYTDLKSIYALACIVVVILLLASLNYVLITVSNSAGRSQEIGVRKVMGARRRNVILQFWVETQLIVVIAALVGMILAVAGVPLLRGIVGSGVTYSDISWREMLVSTLVLAVLLGLLAGYYPAMLISRLKPVSILKSFSTFRVRPMFSQTLVVVQFTCCVALMMAALVINRQMTYIDEKDLGFDKDQVLMVHNPVWELPKQIDERLFQYARTQTSIVSCSAMNGGLDGSYNTSGFNLNGQHQLMRVLTVDYGYFELLGLKLVQGRSFSPLYSTDTAKNVRPIVINETMLKVLGKDAKIGMFNETLGGTIIGVVKDYNFETLAKHIEPEEHRLARGVPGEFLFKIKAGQMGQAIAGLASEWKTITKNYPFEYTFLDDSISRLYEADMRWRKAIELSCGFAILIACMGLFGLAAITAANRTREVGIRKVLGASVSELAGLLSRGFLGMVGLSFLIAAPLSWWLMNRWLDDFAYRIQISWWMFALVGLTAVVVALVTIGFQVLKAARANPVDALRAE
jgi:putative ABC transport system permease protein